MHSMDPRHMAVSFYALLSIQRKCQNTTTNWKRYHWAHCLCHTQWPLRIRGNANKERIGEETRRLRVSLKVTAASALSLIVSILPTLLALSVPVAIIFPRRKGEMLVSKLIPYSK